MTLNIQMTTSKETDLPFNVQPTNKLYEREKENVALSTSCMQEVEDA